MGSNKIRSYLYRYRGVLSSPPPLPTLRGMSIIAANRAALSLLLALLATSAALSVTPLRTPQLRALPRQRAGTVQLVDEPSPEAEATEPEPAAASPATGDDEPETVVVEFNMGFGDKSSPIWQKPKYPDSSGDKETPAALKLVLDYLCKWPDLELWADGMVGRGYACSSTGLTRTVPCQGCLSSSMRL